MHLFEIYLWGVVVSTLIFWRGALRGKAKNPHLWSVLFGLLWFITIPVVVWQVVRAFQEDAKK